VKVVCIAGVGLIGGSFALALREAGFTGKIIGVSSPATVEKALSLGVIDQALPLSEAAALADLVYLAQPISQILTTLDDLDQYVRPGTLITDAGSTKALIVKKAKETIRRGRFIGGHPMAGKDSRGVEAAEASLFRNRPYVLTEADPPLSGWIAKIGARLVILDPEEHDRYVAVTSHLPQLLSTALASVIGQRDGSEEVAGPAACDLTRLALSSYDIWRDILDTNRESVQGAIEEMMAHLRQMQSELTGSSMEQAFVDGAKAARKIRSLG